MSVAFEVEKSLHVHTVEWLGRRYRAGTSASVALFGGFLAYGMREFLPWPRFRGPAILALTACAYAACFKRVEDSQ